MFGFRKGGLIVVHPLKIYQNTKLYGPMLIGACFSFVRHFVMVASMELKVMVAGHLQWQDLPTEYNKIY
jgi:hypothetical protein